MASSASVTTDHTVSSAKEGIKRILFVLSSHTQVPDTNIITGFSLLDLARAYRVLSIYRYDIHITSIFGGKPEPDLSSSNTNDEDVKWFLSNPSLSTLIMNTDRLEEHHGHHWNAIYFVGGNGCMWDYNVDSPIKGTVNRISRECYDNGGVLAAIGHGVLALTLMTISIRSEVHSFIKEMSVITGTTNIEEDSVFPVMKNHFPLYRVTSSESSSAVAASEEDADKVHEEGYHTVEDILTKIFQANFSGVVPYANHVCIHDRIITGQNPNSAEGVANRIISLLCD